MNEAPDGVFWTFWQEQDAPEFTGLCSVSWPKLTEDVGFVGVLQEVTALVVCWGPVLTFCTGKNTLDGEFNCWLLAEQEVVEGWRLKVGEIDTLGVFWAYVGALTLQVGVGRF